MQSGEPYGRGIKVAVILVVHIRALSMRTISSIGQTVARPVSKTWCYYARHIINWCTKVVIPCSVIMLVPCSFVDRMVRLYLIVGIIFLILFRKMPVLMDLVLIVYWQNTYETRKSFLVTRLKLRSRVLNIRLSDVPDESVWIGP